MNYKDIQIRNFNNQLALIIESLSSSDLNQKQKIQLLEQSRDIQKNIQAICFQNQNNLSYASFENLHNSYFNKIVEQKTKQVFKKIDNFLILEYNINNLPEYRERRRSFSSFSQKSQNLSQNKYLNKSQNKAIVTTNFSLNSQTKQQTQNINYKIKPQLLKNKFTPEKISIQNKKKSIDKKLEEKKSIITKPINIRQNYQLQIEKKEKSKSIQIKSNNVSINKSKSPQISKVIKTPSLSKQQKISPNKLISQKPIQKQQVAKQQIVKSSIKIISPLKPQKKNQKKINIADNLSYEKSPNKTKKITQVEKKDQVKSPQFQEFKLNKNLQNLRNSIVYQQNENNYYSFEQKEDRGNFAIQQNLIIENSGSSDMDFQTGKNSQFNNNQTFQKDLYENNQEFEFFDSYDQVDFQKLNDQDIFQQTVQSNKIVKDIQKFDYQQMQSLKIRQNNDIIQNIEIYSTENLEFKNKKNNFIKLFNFENIFKLIFEFLGYESLQIVYNVSNVFKQNRLFQNNKSIQKLDQDESLKRVIKIYKNIYDKNQQYSYEQFKDFILNQQLDEFNIKDQKLKRILIIYIIKIEKFQYLQIDDENLYIKLISQNYFKDITIFQIIQNFNNSDSIDQNKLQQIKIILQQMPINELFNLEFFTQIQQNIQQHQNNDFLENIDIHFIAQQLIENLILNELYYEFNLNQIINDNIDREQKLNDTRDDIKAQQKQYRKAFKKPTITLQI